MTDKLKLLVIDESKNDKILRQNFDNFTATMKLYGFQGSTGAEGIQGAPGAQGAQGAQGAPGIEGPTGNSGFGGDTGAVGSQGLTSIGSTGSQGAVGPPGPIGVTGAQGSDTIGPQGDSGDPGDPGDIGGSATNYLALTDTPANFTDTNNAVTVNNAATATTHTNIRARLNRGNNPTGSYSASLGSGGSSVVSGNYGVNSGSGTSTFILQRSGSATTANRSFTSSSSTVPNIWNGETGAFVVDSIISSRPVTALGVNFTNPGDGDASTLKYNVALVGSSETLFQNSSRYCSAFFDNRLIGNTGACYFSCNFKSRGFSSNGGGFLDNSKYVFSSRTNYSSVQAIIGGSYQHLTNFDISSSPNYSRGNHNVFISSSTPSQAGTTKLYGSYCSMIDGIFKDVDDGTSYCSGIYSSINQAQLSIGNPSTELTNSKFCSAIVGGESNFRENSSYCYAGSCYAPNHVLDNINFVDSPCKFSAAISTGGTQNFGATYCATIGSAYTHIGTTSETGATQCIILGSHAGKIQYDSANCAIISSGGTSRTTYSIMNATGAGFVNESALISVVYGSVNANNCVVMGKSSALNSNTDQSLTVNTLIYNSLTVVSDERLKKDIERLEPDPSILDKILKVGTYKYKFLKDHSKMPHHLGFIAQDIGKYFPCVLNQDKVDPDWLGLDQEQILYIAWETLQILIQKNKKLKKLINQIQTKTKTKLKS